MRVKNSIINILFGLGNQIAITSLSFFSRTVFINTLGIEYLGVNGLLTNILAMLSLAEAGIGASIVYSLYKPVAENDHRKINILMKFYRNCYFVIAIIILLLGLLIMPFLSFFIKDSNVNNIHLIYIIFLLNTVLPYLYVHKNQFLYVCQKAYIVTGIYTLSSIITLCLKISILHFTHNYILYLVIDSITILLTSIILVKIVNIMYPYLKNKVIGTLDKDMKQSITKNVKAIILQNLGNYLVVGTDNIIISSFISVAAVGLYSNYNMLIEICRNFTNQISNNIYHSVGNLVAEENIEKIFSIFKIYRLLTFWLYSQFSIILYIVISPFISLWIGKAFLMNDNVLLVLLLIFYERGMRNAISTVKTTAGIFHEDRYVPIFQAAINLIFSIVLVHYIGIMGVFMGTLVSTIAGPFWATPYLVYKKVFRKPIFNYYLTYFYFAIIGIATYFLVNLACSSIIIDSWLNLIISSIVCIIVPNIIYILIFRNTDEFKYLLNIIKSFILKIVNKFKKNKIYKTGISK
ncbi:hypothetical protein I6J18_02120 [Peribacillus psychrosaccharolyticus]|uniref:Flippase n=1 Tax=Peribacillus psychrosaccharolyticus TaxID=1407 RepID=A0A974NN28_PERPY|nr:hypothetical protein [Peribacillus psychrosaccharolyticus]MEC2056051.1 hypothetical protein [Peribacillus psychrosaccharolyticus]MED3745492.1 hypothetical protein [Peribacillus psychrosaccharolyticus]QQT00751.1 hypothetical protein I6J18_02120 [Peribacillus psychrosaccharolyticus]